MNIEAMIESCTYHGPSDTPQMVSAQSLQRSSIRLKNGRKQNLQNQACGQTFVGIVEANEPILRSLHRRDHCTLYQLASPSIFKELHKLLAKSVWLSFNGNLKESQSLDSTYMQDMGATGVVQLVLQVETTASGGQSMAESACPHANLAYMALSEKAKNECFCSSRKGDPCDSVGSRSC